VPEPISDERLTRFKRETNEASRDDPYAWRDSPVDPVDIRGTFARLDKTEARIVELENALRTARRWIDTWSEIDQLDALATINTALGGEG
jgi:hypothetical protein